MVTAAAVTTLVLGHPHAVTLLPSSVFRNCDCDCYSTLEPEHTLSFPSARSDGEGCRANYQPVQSNGTPSPSHA